MAKYDDDDGFPGDVFITPRHDGQEGNVSRRVVVHTYTNRGRRESRGQIWVGITGGVARSNVRWTELTSEEIDDLIVGLQYAKLLADNPEMRPNP